MDRDTEREMEVGGGMEGGRKRKSCRRISRERDEGRECGRERQR